MKWNEVKDDKDIVQLNEVYSWFEDAVIVSMGYVSGNSVDSELFGHMEMKNDLRVVFQRLDNEPFSIELWFYHTKHMNLVFTNPADNRMADIMEAKVCRNDESVFWTVWKDFDPYDPENLDGTMLIEAEGLRWRVVRDKAEDDEE